MKKALQDRGINVLPFSKVEKKYGKQVVWLCVSLFLGLLVFLIDSDISIKSSVVPVVAEHTTTI